MDLDRDLEAAIDHVMTGFASLSVHPDVVAGIRALERAGFRLVTLSNGAAAVADRLFTTAGVRDAFEELLSVEDAGIWKPAARAYEFAAHRCQVDTSEMLLVAVHPWDSTALRTPGCKRDGSTEQAPRTRPTSPHLTARSPP
ncbi:MAG: HAD family hydrolase [Nocardioidaceae bacterium]